METSFPARCKPLWATCWNSPCGTSGNPSDTQLSGARCESTDGSPNVHVAVRSAGTIGSPVCCPAFPGFSDAVRASAHLAAPRRRSQLSGDAKRKEHSLTVVALAELRSDAQGGAFLENRRSWAAAFSSFVETPQAS